MEQQSSLFQSALEAPAPTMSAKIEKPAPKAAVTPAQGKPTRRNRKVPAYAIKPHQYCINSLWRRLPKTVLPPDKAKALGRKQLKVKLEESGLSNAELDTRYRRGYVRLDTRGNAYHWTRSHYVTLCQAQLETWSLEFLQPLLAGQPLTRRQQFDWWRWMLFPDGLFTFWTCVHVTGFELPDAFAEPSDLRRLALARGLLPVWLDALFDLPEDEQLIGLKALSAHDKSVRSHPTAAPASSVAA